MADQKNKQSRSSDSDKRYVPRWEVANPVECRAEKSAQIIEGVTKDLSCAGACINVENHLVPKQKIRLTVQLSKKEFVDLRGQIVWVKRDQDEFQVGISFYGTSVEAQDLILQHAFSLNKKTVLQTWFKGWQD